MGHGNAKATRAPQPEPKFDIRLESGEIVEKLEGNAEVVPVMDGASDGTFPWEKEKPKLLFFVFVHGGSPSPPIVFLSRGSRMCHRSPTNCIEG